MSAKAIPHGATGARADGLPRDGIPVEMRAGMPSASFLAFTGMPLLGRNRKTHEWIGDENLDEAAQE